MLLEKWVKSSFAETLTAEGLVILDQSRQKLASQNVYHHICFTETKTEILFTYVQQLQLTMDHFTF